ncbi:AMP-binding protein [Xylophilus sp. Kf1]|nr:AMP-binding protein [Xylophilus sp. Kf1]
MIDLEALPEQRLQAAGEPALVDADGQWSRQDLRDEVRSLADRFRSMGIKVVATLMDNCPAWVVADLASSASNLVHIPMPTFFTGAQIEHALNAAGVDALLTNPALAARWSSGLPGSSLRIAGMDMTLLQLPAVPVSMPADTAKVTFTSGSTGDPKGVCLSAASMRAVASGLRQAMAPLDIRRHLCALPFAVLLENIAGLMAPLGLGASCIVLPLEQVGLRGSSSFDVAVFHATVLKHQPNSVILLPQMLRAWTAFLGMTGQKVPECVRFVAVGGAAVGSKLLQAARSAGIPAYEGYGLSEGASVQTLNLPGADKPGSAGRPLPHARLRISASGEIEVAGSLCSGYLGMPENPGDARQPWFATGDIGRLDAEGFLHIEGRRKHLLITAFGRNVSPEWVETTLRAENSILQCVVFGDGQPSLGAVLWPTRPELPDAALQAGVDAANAGLPDYAQVRHWVRAGAAFDMASGMATANGRPRRDAIREAHSDLFAQP